MTEPNPMNTLCAVAILLVLSGCGSGPIINAPDETIPVNMDGGWSGVVSVYVVDNDGAMTLLASYTATAHVYQNKDRASIIGICPGGTESVTARNAFAGASFMRWEGLETCANPAPGVSYMAITRIELHPEADGSAIGYVDGAVTFADGSAMRQVWASARFEKTTPTATPGAPN